MKQNLKHILEIAEATTTDPKTKLQARTAANDCYRYIVELCTNAGTESDALKFVNQSKKKISSRPASMPIVALGKARSSL
jgi:hypothetical protein